MGKILKLLAGILCGGLICGGIAVLIAYLKKYFTTLLSRLEIIGPEKARI